MELREVNAMYLPNRPPLVSPITQPSRGLRKRRTSRGTFLSIVKIWQNRKKVMILRHYKSGK